MDNTLKTFKWNKLGKIFDPSQSYSCEENPEERKTWMKFYAQVPNSILIDSRIRIFISTRGEKDSQGKYISNTGYIELDRKDLKSILKVSENPVINLGRLGEFDEFGVMTQTCLNLKESNKYRIYYTGWTRKSSVPYDWAIGVAESDHKGEFFTKIGSGPLLSANLNQPYLYTGPYVKIIDGVWHMWHAAGIEWDKNSIEPIYQLFHAISKDGIEWIREPKVIFPPKVEKECQSAPCLIQRNGVWFMFFCYRHGIDFRNKERGYRIGCAYSYDLSSWHRNDELAGLSPSSKGWDSEMVCYPSIIEIEDRTIMFYCGNYFGMGGFGAAELVI